MPKDQTYIETICPCGKVFDRNTTGHYFIKGVHYCTPCGVAVNESRKDELQAAMYQELFFGDEM